MKKIKFMLTGYLLGYTDPERVSWYFSTLEEARAAVNRPGYKLTMCDIWELVDTVTPDRQDGDK